MKKVVVLFVDILWCGTQVDYRDQCLNGNGFYHDQALGMFLGWLAEKGYALEQAQKLGLDFNFTTCPEKEQWNGKL